ncbi:MAG TPA: hypothetical protein VGQ29_01925 [Gemmatimonadales bacterium]|nr:hypothetical protein [Gemmatimonadales bacterium]
MEVRLANPVAWPGSDLVVLSPALAGQPALPEVLLDTLHLTVARRDDSTVTARLPDTSGVFALHVKLHGGDRFGSVRIVGFVGRADAPPLTGWPQPTSPGSPVVIAAAESSLVELDLRTGATVDLGIGHSGGCAVSPGLSFRPRAVVAQADTGRCGRAVSWVLDASATPIDSAPLGGFAADRIWAELSPGMWLQTAHHYMRVYRPGDSTLTEQIESGERVVLSPDRSLAIVLATWAPNQVPVVESATGTITFRLPFARAEGVAFSPDGDTIFAAGRANFNADEPERLVAASAASGQVAIDTPVTMPMLWDVVLDPGGRWLYGVALTDSGATFQPIIHVFDRHTLGHVGRIRPPAAVVCRADFCGQISLAIDSSARKLCALEIAGWGLFFSTIPAGIYTFDLVPTTQAAQVLSP